MGKSYEKRYKASPTDHKVYSLFNETLGLSAADNTALKNRGLSAKHITHAGYATKPHNTSNNTQRALAALRSEYGGQLEGVAGFYQQEQTGLWACSGLSGLIIPVRDMDGNIQQQIMRNANPKKEAGRIQNKYVAFSSAGKPKGTKVWQKTHCPVVNGDTLLERKSEEVRITEGVLKADIATARGKYYCLGMHGLKLHDDIDSIIERGEIYEVRICVDSGEDENIDMLRFKCQAIKRFRDLGIDVVVETWDPKFGKGIDDVVVAGYEDKIRELSKEEIEELLKAGNSEDPTNGDWIYIIQSQRFVNLRTGVELKKTQFADRYGLHDPKLAAQLIGNGVRCIDEQAFLPNEEMFFEDSSRSFYNLWRKPSIEPRHGNVITFLRHVLYIFPVQSEARIFLDWLAYNIQRPGDKILWAIVIIGGEGVGKSFFGDVMRLLLGANNTCTPTNEAMHEKYTGWQKATQLVIIEELMAQGRLGLMNKLKPMITQPITQIREMMREPYSHPNRFNFLCFSNHDDALLLSDGDPSAFEVKDNRLVGKSGTAYEGLSFAYAGEEDASISVYMQAGLADRLFNIIEGYTDTAEGLIQQEINALKEQNEDFETEAEEIRTRGEEIRERQIEKYSEMEAKLASLESLRNLIQALLGNDEE